MQVVRGGLAHGQEDANLRARRATRRVSARALEHDGPAKLLDEPRARFSVAVAASTRAASNPLPAAASPQSISDRRR